MTGLGTVVNVVAIVLGGIAGLVLGDRISEGIRRTIGQAFGLVTAAVAIVGLEPLGDDDAGLRRFAILIGALVAGAACGEALRLEERFHALAAALQRRAPDRRDERSFADGFVVATTVFCVGPLAVLGAVEEGLGAGFRLLAVKAALDGISATGFASVYGRGVIASAGVVALYQGALTVAAELVSPVLTDEVVEQLGATGSLLVLGVALTLLDVARIRVVSLLPSLAFAVAGAAIFDALG
ncbi:MAG TPA: DUF554 domain-containing protein [Actinomycetota bacterium]|nr:DUF554 domain-containing protein [Actinomycetota bacterium]